MRHTQKTILVTGGAGYIGSHACKILSLNGYLPVAIDNLIYGHKWAVKWGPLEIGDVTDSCFLDAVFKKYKPIAVIHFAAYAYVGESVIEPEKYYINNVIGTLELLKTCLANNVKKFVFSSTCATYGIPDKIPINEEHIQNPVNPYGSSKLMIEKILNDYQNAYDFRSVSLRYFNAAGADLDSEIGEYHVPETHLIPLILDVAAKLRPKIIIYGNDYPTSDGTCIRDYIHVADLAQAHLNALEYLIDDGRSVCLNLGTGIGYSVRQIIDAVEIITGENVVTETGYRREGDPPELVANADRSKKILKWEPNYSDINVIIQTAWAWHQKLLSL